jgi:hypothetical protein
MGHLRAVGALFAARGQVLGCIRSAGFLHRVALSLGIEMEAGVINPRCSPTIRLNFSALHP